MALLRELTRSLQFWATGLGRGAAVTVKSGCPTPSPFLSSLKRVEGDSGQQTQSDHRESVDRPVTCSHLLILLPSRRQEADIGTQSPLEAFSIGFAALKPGGVGRGGCMVVVGPGRLWRSLWCLSFQMLLSCHLWMGARNVRGGHDSGALSLPFLGGERRVVATGE